jgi:hypothetical protein
MQTARNPDNPSGLVEESVMFRVALKSSIAAAVLASGAAMANIPAPPAYFESGQFSASFAQDSRHWQLLPLAGDAVDIVDRACANTLHLPRGLWLVTRDSADHLQLLAPSTTQLPAGFPEQVPLVACGTGGARGAFGVPDIVLSWLADNSGAVMIDE